MQEDEDYISNEDIKEIGEEKMKNETNSRVINEWLAKTNRTLDDLPESLRGLLSKEVENPRMPHSEEYRTVHRIWAIIRTFNDPHGSEWGEVTAEEVLDAIEDTAWEVLKHSPRIPHNRRVEE